MRPSKALAAAALLAAALPVGSAAQDLPDLHLGVPPHAPREARRAALVTAPPLDPTQAQRFELRSGGAGTVRARAGADAFSQPAANLTPEQRMDFVLGEALFQRPWVSAPSSTIASDGLGPLFNARACALCHRQDGRGQVPDGSDEPSGLVLHLSVPAPEGTPGPEGIAEWVATLPEPTYGAQLQDHALPGHRAEGRVVVTWEEIPVDLSGGETASLRRPLWSVADPASGPLAAGAMLSPRVAPPLIGLGLLEAIPEVEILALADPEDADGDGISGRASIVWSADHDAPMLGRFGHKAGMPTLRAQVASAFHRDLGLSSALHRGGWGDCTEVQAECRAAPDGADPEQGGLEVSDAVLDLVTFYTAMLGVPARRGVEDAEVLRGRTIFHETGCAACHRPAFVTATLPDAPERSFQLIWPYTDLLLHDMGEDLADNRPEGRASGREWRTPPLWGIGLTGQVSGHTQFLHDGRARSLLEAILWHGGEAQAARDEIVALAPDDRAALLRFLESL
ncbi:di-heme oxidoreductase family protein [Pararhodobacter sp.]|uniref:di-heme oxidoreductase family protein n=1 Tax=Pararhodobacter sp. TaxID=2127056 RepID=UPI003FA706E1